MKYLLAFFIISILAACSGEDSAKSNSQSSKNSEPALNEEHSKEEKLLNQQAKDGLSKVRQRVSLVKQCSAKSCENYHLMINLKNVLSVNYSAKKKKPTSFVLTNNNVKVFNSLLDQVTVLQTEQLIRCLNSSQNLANFSLTLGEGATAKSYLFAIGCKQDPDGLKELAQWFDNKAYFVENN